MEYINYINSFANAQAIDDALSTGTLQRPYTALDLSTGKVVFGKVLPPEPAETRLVAAYNQGNTTICSADEPYPYSKVELEDGTDITNDLVNNYGAIDYAPLEESSMTLYFTMVVDNIIAGMFNAIDISSCIVPEGITNVGDDAFRTVDFETTRRLVFPTSLTAVGSACFCVGDTMTGDKRPDSGMTIEFRGTVPPSIAADTFGDASKGAMPTIYVPASAVQAYKTTWGAINQAYADAVLPKQ